MLSKLKMKLKLNSSFMDLLLIMMMLWKLKKSSNGVTKKPQSGLTKFSILLNSKLSLKFNHLLHYILVISLKPTLLSKLSMELLKLLMKPISDILTKKLLKKNMELKVNLNLLFLNIMMNYLLNIKENLTSNLYRNSSYSINTLWLLISTKELPKNFMEKANLLCSYFTIRLSPIINYKLMLNKLSEITPKD